jgi:GNAT superfamily N-acetyltransferase
MKRLIKSLARAVLGDYAIYHIYSAPRALHVLSNERREFSCAPLERAQAEASDEPLLRQQAGFFGVGAHAYGCWYQGRLVGLCVYWFGDRYRTRNFWPLEDGEAKLVQVVVVPQVRARGVASWLIAQSREHMQGRGFGRMFARIWHSNVPSLRAFQNAGWGRVATVLEVDPLRLGRPWRIWPAKRSHPAADRASPSLTEG